MGQGIGTQLEVNHFTTGSLARFAVERSSRGPGGPQTFALPSGFRIVDAAVEPFGEKADGVWNAQDHPLAVDQREQRIGIVAGSHGNILAQAEGVELIDPIVIVRVGAAVFFAALELWPWR